MNKTMFLTRDHFLQKRAHAIADVAHAWLKPSSIWMKEAKKKIPLYSSYSAKMVEACLKTVFKNYTIATLEKWIEQDLSRKDWNHPSQYKILILAPATVFAASWQAATAAWLAGASVVLKPSKREPFFGKILQKSVQAIAGTLLPIQCVDRSYFKKNDLLKDNFSAIVLYGKDSTIQYFRSISQPKNRLVEFGSKLSVGLIVKKGLWQKNPELLIHGAAFDTVLYETQGCLSPHCFFVKEEGSFTAKIFAAQLAKKIKSLQKKLPQKKVLNEDLEQTTFWHRWQFRESQKQAQIFSQTVILHENSFVPCGLRRVVFVIPIAHLNQFPLKCGKWLSRISTIALSDKSLVPEVKSQLDRKYRIRFCETGQMHLPPPDWHNGGVNLLQKLNHFIQKDS